MDVNCNWEKFLNKTHWCRFSYISVITVMSLNLFIRSFFFPFRLKMFTSIFEKLHCHLFPNPVHKCRILPTIQENFLNSSIMQWPYGNTMSSLITEKTDRWARTRLNNLTAEPVFPLTPFNGVMGVQHFCALQWCNQNLKRSLCNYP